MTTEDVAGHHAALTRSRCFCAVTRSIGAGVLSMHRDGDENGDTRGAGLTFEAAAVIEPAS